MTDKDIKTIAILTGGGDCPGLNAVIRAVAKTAMNKYNLNVIGIEDGFLGLIENRMRELSYWDVSGILNEGGTILGTSNKANPFAHPVDGEKVDVSDECIKTLKAHHIDAVVCLGGDGTMAMTHQFSQKGVKVIGVPKTIDNDLVGTDLTFGFDTAVATATDAIDKLHTTASSHHRVMIVEVMGRYAGWIALFSGVAGGGDVILIPEIPYSLDKVCEYVVNRSKRGRAFSLVIVAEGAKEEGGGMVIREQVTDSPDPVRLGGISYLLSDKISKQTRLESRGVNLGHIIRGGTPTAFDRYLATAFGYLAMEMLMGGGSGKMVAFRKGEFSAVSLKEVAGKNRMVPADHDLVHAARAVGTCFGD